MAKKAKSRSAAQAAMKKRSATKAVARSSARKAVKAKAHDDGQRCGKETRPPQTAHRD